MPQKLKATTIDRVEDQELHNGPPQSCYNIITTSKANYLKANYELFYSKDFAHSPAQCFETGSLVFWRYQRPSNRQVEISIRLRWTIKKVQIEFKIPPKRNYVITERVNQFQLKVFGFFLDKPRLRSNQWISNRVTVKFLGRRGVKCFQGSFFAYEY